MPAPLYSAEDFTRALQALLPRGRVWPREEDTEQTTTLKGLAPSCERLNARANNLLIDGFPASTLELLPEWEATLGLPDPCAGEAATLQQRRNQVVARFIAGGGQSIPYFIDFAADLGYSITITQYAPFRAGHSHAGDPCGSEDWFFTWAVNAPLNTITYFRAGQSTAGEPLASWGNDVLECELNAIKPAHTILQFHYS